MVGASVGWLVGTSVGFTVGGASRLGMTDAVEKDVDSENLNADPSLMRTFFKYNL